MGYPQDLDEIARDIHAWARSKGFYARETLGTIPAPQYHVPSADPSDGPQTIVNPSLPSEKLMLIVSEVAEVQDALRDGDKAHEAEEVADILIRTLDYAAWRGISIQQELWKKMGKNHERPHLHGRAAF